MSGGRDMIRACIVGRRGLSSGPRLTSWMDDSSATGTVLVSTSNDVILNLALEDWLYQKLDWTLCPPTLLLWRNAPCVVIGRHQNPWVECRLSSMANAAVTLARRNSGGGTVFHDMGNLNCTFFTSRAAYDRRTNLELICKALKDRRPELDVRVSSRLDILLDDHYKISGTASKLGRNMAYHHCTVLVDVDTGRLSQVLRKSDIAGVESKATQSVKSPVRNLEGLSIEDVSSSIARLFAHQQATLVEPTEDRFPGITEIARHLRSWDWIFGKCPPFKLERTIRVPKEVVGGSSDENVAVFKASICKGVIESASIDNHDDLHYALQSLVGSKLSPTDDDWSIRLASNDLKNWIVVSCFADLF